MNADNRLALSYRSSDQWRTQRGARRGGRPGSPGAEQDTSATHQRSDRGTVDEQRKTNQFLVEAGKSYLTHFVSVTKLPAPSSLRYNPNGLAHLELVFCFFFFFSFPISASFLLFFYFKQNTDFKQFQF
jgi:hypothetical protein